MRLTLIFFPVILMLTPTFKPTEECTALDGAKLHRIRSRLLEWFEHHRRQMEWRETTDPYAIWVSEIMLQQTQVKTVEPYYRRFMERFPTVRDLADAGAGEVMKVWEGLGYYGRARHLHRAAKAVMVRFGGDLPDTKEALLSLPGIGPYTVGAILSIAFGRREPVLDGNVIRVLTRINHITENVQLSGTRKRLWQLAEQLLPQDRCSEFNQSLMELGALVCRPKNPHCDVCPIQQDCVSRQIGIQEQLPVKPPRKSVPHYDVTAGIIRRNGMFLITLRPPEGLLGGLWEFPGGKREEGETLEDCLRREIKEELGVDIVVGDLFIKVPHAYTHFRITLYVYECRLEKGRIRCRECDAFQWIREEDLECFAFPAADRKVINKMLQSST